jgi:hypothetical protein
MTSNHTTTVLDRRIAVTASHDDYRQPEPGRRLLRAGGHTSPRIRTPIRFRSRSTSGLRADHRHVLPPRLGPGLCEEGFSTAELLGNAALGIAALIAIWVVLEALGIRVVAWIGSQIGVG